MDYFTYLRGGNFPNMNFENSDFGNSYSAAMPWPLSFQDKSVQFNLNSLITMVKNSITNEGKDNLEYTALAKLAPNEEQEKMIYSIRDDEMLHGKILRKIFSELTGVMIPETMQNTNNSTNTKTYMQMLDEAFKGELKAIERYREMLAYAPNKEIYSMLMYIMTDEIRHALKYEHLMLLNK